MVDEKVPGERAEKERARSGVKKNKL